MKLLVSFAVTGLLSMSLAAHASSFFDSMRIEARAAIVMLKSSDHWTREKGAEKLREVEAYLDHASKDSDHYTRELAFELKQEIEALQNKN